MATALWITFGLATLVYLVISFFAVRASMKYGHRGDLTFPVTALYLAGSFVLWVSSAIALIQMTFLL